MMIHYQINRGLDNPDQRIEYEQLSVCVTEISFHVLNSLSKFLVVIWD